ncbi:MAG: N-acetylneuraminate synthase [Gemmatimonadales bacterium]
MSGAAGKARRPAALVVGCGSIGQRHIRNLRCLTDEPIIAYRATDRDLREFEREFRVTPYDDLARALAAKPRFAIIANPTALHVPAAIAAAQAGCDLFIEKPVAHNLDGLDELERVVRERGVRVFVGCVMRFHPAVRRVKRVIDSGRLGHLVSVRIQAGSYLPGWRASTPYESSYSARADMGGGVLLDLIHEIDYCLWWMGRPVEVSSFSGHVSSLAIDTEDVAEILLRFAGGAIGEIHLDYVQRVTQRTSEVVGEAGTVRADLAGNRVELADASAGQWVEEPVEPLLDLNELYVAELRHFLDIVERGAAPLVPLDDGIAALRIVAAARRSDRTQRVETPARPSAGATASPGTPGFAIAGRSIGAGFPTYVIAEAGVNHNGDLHLALKLVEAAAAAGADAVKFQTFSADRLVARNAPKADYQQRTTGAAESQHEMLRRLELGADAYRKLAARARTLGIGFLSTPFDRESADLLEELGVPAFKIGSGDLTDLPLLGHIARKGRPVILSTGMSWLAEVETAVAALRRAGQKELALLHCVSNYPARAEDANLRAMDALRARFEVPVGYSDHTGGIEVALAAVALGACIVEKHLTLDRKLPGPDHESSLEPADLASLVQAIRAVEVSLGDGQKRPVRAEVAMRDVGRKSVVALVDLAQGKAITRDMLGALRPGTGIAPAEIEALVGRIPRTDVRAGTLLAWEMLE